MDTFDNLIAAGAPNTRAASGAKLIVARDATVELCWNLSVDVEAYCRRAGDQGGEQQQWEAGRDGHFRMIQQKRMTRKRTCKCVLLSSSCKRQFSLKLKK